MRRVIVGWLVAMALLHVVVPLSVAEGLPTLVQAGGTTIAQIIGVQRTRAIRLRLAGEFTEAVECADLRRATACNRLHRKNR